MFRQYLANYLVFLVDRRSVLSGERAEAEESVDDVNIESSVVCCKSPHDILLVARYRL